MKKIESHIRKGMEKGRRFLYFTFIILWQFSLLANSLNSNDSISISLKPVQDKITQSAAELSSALFLPKNGISERSAEKRSSEVSWEYLLPATDNFDNEFSFRSSQRISIFGIISPHIQNCRPRSPTNVRS